MISGAPPIAHRPTFWLSLMYLLMAIVVIFQIVSTVYHKYKMVSYHFAFLVLCFIFNITRVVGFMFFFALSNSSTTAFSVIFRVPVNIQFATMCLLVLFFANVVYQTKWEVFKVRAWVSYSVCNFIFLIALIVSVSAKNTETSLKIITAITAGTMLVMISTITVFGIKVRRLILLSRNPDPKLWGITPTKITIATGLIVVIYFTRVVYVILTQISQNFSLYFGSTRISQIPQEILAAGLYTIWEIVPTVLILILFWRSNPTKTLSSRGGGIGYFKGLFGVENINSSPIHGHDKISNIPLLGNLNSSSENSKEDVNM